MMGTAAGLSLWRVGLPHITSGTLTNGGLKRAAQQGRILLRGQPAGGDAGGDDAVVPVWGPPGQHLDHGGRERECERGAALPAVWRDALHQRADADQLPVYRAKRSCRIGIVFLRARWYDSSLARFIQADTLIPSPGNPMAWDRYTYTLNNPIGYKDPSGHFAIPTGVVVALGVLLKVIDYGWTAYDVGNALITAADKIILLRSDKKH